MPAAVLSLHPPAHTATVLPLPADRRRAAPQLAPDAPLFVVLNRRSGHHGTPAGQRLGELLRAAGHRHELLVARRPADLPRLAQQAVQAARDAGGVIVAAGGDGTLNTVAQAVLPSGLPMGILPQGTFNYFGRANAVSQDLTEALAALLAGVQAGHTRAVQVGLVNDRIFLVNASLGLYPRLLEDREALKRRLGRSRLVALWSGLRTLLGGQRELLLHLDASARTGNAPAQAGTVMRTSTLFVGNNPLQLERLGLDEADDVRQGSLAAVLMPPLSRSARLGLALRGALGTLDGAEELTRFASRALRVEPLSARHRRGIKVAIDGESLFLAAPLHFRVAPQRLHLVVPPQASSEHVPGGQAGAGASGPAPTAP
ncbi:MAG: diacylglycerol kinase [Burkholderiales bacterium]|nr:diacylglycerol kinase [Burkholderiales bacterium]